MTIRHMQNFFEPRSIAVIGASERSGSVGAAVLDNLLAAGFAGDLFPVNPRGGDTIRGLERIRDVSRLPYPPDLAVICTSPARIPGIVGDLGRTGVHAVMIVMGGLGLPPNRGKDILGNPLGLAQSLLSLRLAGGKTLKDLTWEAARGYDMRILGPNCMGTIVPRRKLNASYSHLMVADGAIAFVGQSAAAALAMLDWAQSRNIGLSHVTTVGDSLDIELADVIEYLADDARTRAILLHVEQVESGRKMVSALRAAARTKLVIALKSPPLGGMPPERPPGQVSHDMVWDAVFRRTGVLRIQRTDELFNALETLTRSRRLDGGRLAIVGNGPGPSALALDYLRKNGGHPARLSDATRAALEKCLLHPSLAANPVDLTIGAAPDVFGKALHALQADEGVDAILVVHVPTLIAPSRETAETVASAAGGTDKPILTSWMGGETAQAGREAFDAHGVPTYDSPEQAIDAFMYMARHARNQSLLDQVPAAVGSTGTLTIDAAAVRNLVSLAQREDREQLNGKESRRVLECAGIPVHEGSGKKLYRLRGLPLAMGIARDPVFGPVLYFGTGGDPANALADRQVGLPPPNLNLARMLIDATSAGQAIEAFNRQPAAVRETLAEMLVRLGQLASDVTSIERLDVRPLIINKKGVQVLGAKIVRGKRAETAIIPYPAELEEIVALRSGRNIVLRPIRPEDAPAHAAFAQRLSPESIRFRFFAPRSSITQHELALFTQIDYAREMAFIASARNADGRNETLGVVRSWTDPDNVSAEFAVLIQDSMRGQGLGSALMNKMIDYTRGRGTLEIRGTVLPDNDAMLGLAKSLGFSRRYSDQDEAELVSLRLNDPTDEWQLERLNA